jgi:hypothetical protein
VVLDDETAARLVKEKRAEIVAPDPPQAMISTACPRCGSAMQHPAAVEPSARWVQCLNTKCNHRWLR